MSLLFIGCYETKNYYHDLFIEKENQISILDYTSIVNDVIERYNEFNYPESNIDWYIIKGDFFDGDGYDKNSDSFLKIDFSIDSSAKEAGSGAFNVLRITELYVSCQESNQSYPFTIFYNENNDTLEASSYLSMSFLRFVGCMNDVYQTTDINISLYGIKEYVGYTDTEAHYYSSNTLTISAQEINEARALYEAN